MRVSQLNLTISVTLLSLAGASLSAQAGFALDDCTNYAVLYEGSGSHSLKCDSGNISGNIGIGAPTHTTTATVQLSSSTAKTTINGNLYFDSEVNISGREGSDYEQSSGSVSAHKTAVSADLAYLNSLSASLGGEAGTSVDIQTGETGRQTINVSNGKLDANGNRVFNVSDFSFGKNTTLTLNGDGAGDSVVFNFSDNATFGGTISLANGLKADQVIFNFASGSGDDGGKTLKINANGGTEYGTFLNPNGQIIITNSVVQGRVFGGGSQDEEIESGGSVIAPNVVPTPVPEPEICAMIAMGIAGLWVARWRRN